MNKPRSFFSRRGKVIEFSKEHEITNSNGRRRHVPLPEQVYAGPVPPGILKKKSGTPLSDVSQTTVFSLDGKDLTNYDDDNTTVSGWRYLILLVHREIIDKL